MRARWCAVAALLLASLATAAANPFKREILFHSAEREALRFPDGDAAPIDAELVTLLVPEKRGEKDSRSIAVRFVRLPAAAPNGIPPVVYLTGGAASEAGGGEAWALLSALRQVTDVILFDERGTGLSDPLPLCESTYGWAASEDARREAFIVNHRRAFKQCVAFWSAAGIDLDGFNPEESAADIAAMAEVLGGPVSLLGIGKGSQLALATVKEHPEAVERMVLASVRGLAQTVNYPAGGDAYLDRLQEAIDADPAAAARYPDIKGMIREAVARLDAEPLELPRGTPEEDGPSAYLVDGFYVQRLVSAAVANPADAMDVVEGIARYARHRDAGFLIERAPEMLPDAIAFAGPPVLTELATGIDQRRLDRVRQQMRDAVLGDALSFPMPHLSRAGRDYRLPDGFRKRPRGRTFLLVISGVLDGEAFPDEVRKATRGLQRRRSIITVENAGRSAVFDVPGMEGMVVRFLSGDAVPTQTITAEPALPAGHAG